MCRSTVPFIERSQVRTGHDGLHEMRAALLSLLVACGSPDHDAPDAARPDADVDAPVTETHCIMPTEVTWTDAAAAPISREETQAIAVGRKLYIVGGYYNGLVVTVELWAYDIDADGWTRLADAPDKITHAGQETDGTRIYLAGALLGDGLGPSTRQTWIYDIGQNSWSSGAPLPEPRGAGALARLDHSLHYFGGGIRSVPETPIEQDTPDHWTLDLDQARAEWKPAAPMPDPRNHLGATVIGDHAYAIGGQHRQDEDLGNSSAVHRFAAGDGWQARANMPRPLGHNSAATVSAWDCAVVLGGTTIGGVNVANVVAFDPEANAWSELTPLPEGGRVSAGVIDHRIVAVVGTRTFVGTPIRASFHRE